MQYSFGVLTYNQEKYILELLESIKYQINNYGKDIECYLYLSDDASVDHTVELARKWLAMNESLFLEYEIITSPCNEGTTNNYYKVLNKIHTEFFKIIAGDDVFANSDVFEELKNNEYGGAVAHIPLILKDGKLELSKEFIYKNLIHQNERRSYKKDLLHMRYGGYINTPSFFPTRSMINEECINFMRQFTVFEDDPTWYMLIKTNQNVRIKFDIKIRVLYRMHNESVSNSSHMSEKWYRDLLKLKKRYLEDSDNVFLNIFLKLHMAEIKYNYENDKCWKYTPYRMLEIIRRIITGIIGRKYLSHQMYEELRLQCLKNEEYYNEITKIAGQKLKEWRNNFNE